MADFKKVANTLDAAELVGVGGKQRDLVEYAIRLLTREYIQSSVEAGNSPFDAGKVITELVEQETSYNYTRK